MGRYTETINFFLSLYNSLTGKKSTLEDINREATERILNTELGEILFETFREEKESED